MKPITINPRKFISAVINEFYDKSIEINGKHFVPDDHYSSGHCAELAFSLAKFAGNHGLDSEISILYRIERCGDTNEEDSRTLSHCILCVENNSFDINGENADENWTSTFDEIASEKWNLVNDWEYVDIPYSPKTEDDSYDKLKEHCDKFMVSLDKDRIDKDLEILSSVTSGLEANHEYH